ncbi:hypothetical protein MTO96_020125 [Rhipicephalus appendiculatus]
MVYDLYCENTDMVVLMMPTDYVMLAASTYGDIIFMPETFYARESEIEAPSLYDTTLRSALAVAVTAASLTVCAGLLVLIGGPHLHERAQTETLFLLALFLARSTPFPNATRWPRVRNVVYLFWAFSDAPAVPQYFQGELTSVVTVRRPANSLDTLDELEATLDAGVAAPCIPKGSSTLDIILNWDHPTTLGKKLRASLSKHWDQLVTANLRACFECARRSGSVCYARRMTSSLSKRLCPNVVAFDENFIAWPHSMPLRKTFPLRDAYRAFLQRVREGGLLSSPYCKQDAACVRSFHTKRSSQTEKPLFELHGFFALYAVLLSGGRILSTASCIPIARGRWVKTLYASLLKHRDYLLKDGVRSCPYWATKSDGVCKAARMPSSSPDIAKGTTFNENFVT